ncbi:MAG TPA: DUF4388 domain-containing protein [Thermoanaerobaculales bacterium]|nr:DUF4388 domain-containing protein [Thermoanaerobaculales bacterium]HQN96594.1 DUF4388 domain-containing protein [Thermoanaerobaculales bacterium]
MAGTPVDKYEQREALEQLQRYLSDTIAPMIFVDSMDTLLATPLENIAAQVVSWVASLHGTDSQLATADYLFHAAKKIHLLGELELIPREQSAGFLRGLRPYLLGACPEQDRRSLATDLDNLELSQGAEAPSVVGHIHRAGGGEVSRGSSVRAERPSEPVAGPASGEGESVARGFLRGLRRVNMLLDRMAGRADVPAGPAATTAVVGAAEGQTLVARIVTEAADRATSSDELHGSLEELRGRGLEIDAGQLLRLLAHNLPNWAPPPVVDQEAPMPQGAARAMGQLVSMSRSPGEKAQRFQELVNSAVEEFNGGSLGRAVTMIDLAERLAESQTVDTATVTAAHSRAYDALDQGRLREYLEDEDKHHLLRRVMSFFPRFAPTELFAELEIESNRDRRRFLLMVLNAQAETTRKAALEALHEVVAGEASYPWFFERNLVYLLRTTRRPPDAPADPEIDVLVPMSELEGPLPLVREALATLGQLQHDRAVTALVARVSELEDSLLGKRQLPHTEDELRALLDSVVGMLARSPAKEARRCVVQHGLKRQPQLGNTLARMSKLSTQDLSEDRAVVDRLVRGLREELPTKVLGLTVITGRKARNVERIIQALSGTDAPVVREVLGEIVESYSGQEFATAAARALAQLGTAAHPDEAPSAALTGDLDLFGLPSLLQNLSDSQLSGVLTVLDGEGQTAASVALESGFMTSAEAGDLRGEVAVYQLLEKPVRGRFVFVKQEPARGADRTGSGSKPVAPMLFEGIRRYDEFMRAAALAPDGARYRSTGKRPTNVVDEPNTDLVKNVWKRALEGAAPDDLERELPVDSYRVRRLFEHWLGEGSIELADSPGAAAGS